MKSPIASDLPSDVDARINECSRGNVTESPHDVTSAASHLSLVNDESRSDNKSVLRVTFVKMLRSRAEVVGLI